MPDKIIEQVDLEGLVHDLNNIFQTIGENAEYLQTDPKWKNIADALRRSVDRGRRVARSILDSQRSAVDADLVVRRAMQFAADYLECVHCAALEFDQSIDATILPGDPAAWERVLVNLFLNAAEAGATRIQIEIENGHVIVRDNGPGIAPALLPTIFQPHVSTKSIFSGLGLHVVKSLVEEHGASVTAANRPGGGAEFRVDLHRALSAK